MGDEETIQGARNRCAACLKAVPEADYYCGLEGGCDMKKEEMSCFAWMVIMDKHGKEGKSRTGVFTLPPQVAALVKSGLELGYANDQVFKTTGSKRSGGAVGILTSGVVDRTQYYEQALVLALIPFHMPALYP